ncbi:unnamed protein product [Candidula unifasciata]|uniref:Dehydrogenase/reductase SDR family member 7 n=1 Tax=Candidula unifasciata TaxID=100452 RepID=A0A8S3ZY33_9EUPU|nr:unnamed protein product [Candidula unifasciata]
MVCWLSLLAIAAVVAVVVWLIALARSDGDLKLMFYAKFGKQPDNLAGKVVWITGASSGIGEYIAYCLAEAGARLVLSARRTEELEKVKQKCLQQGGGGGLCGSTTDCVDFESHKPAVQKVLEFCKILLSIDILINNAGRGQRSPWMEVELDVDRQLFEVNVLGPVSLTQQVLPHMLQRKQGQIVVVSSLAGKISSPYLRSYTASKHAVNGYFESLRTEMGEHNIDVTILCPGPVASNISYVAVTGKLGEVSSSPITPGKLMPTDRCAYLSAVAIANKLYEAWISENPSLVFMYLFQYFPDFARCFMVRVLGLLLLGVKAIATIFDWEGV